VNGRHHFAFAGAANVAAAAASSSASNVIVTGAPATTSFGVARCNEC
jgi:hypothetical protein